MKILTDNEYLELKKLHSIKVNELTRIEEDLICYEKYTNPNNFDYFEGSEKEAFLASSQEYVDKKKLLEEEENDIAKLYAFGSPKRSE